ncbi:MAG: DUF4440 domain-containing protein [Candidatus Baltobacteraceae bacterium]
MRKTIFALMLLTIAQISLGSASPGDIATIRALRLENNRAIESHNVPLMRHAWAPTIRLIESDGTIFSGSRTLAASYATVEFRDTSFVAYVRRPTNITIGADGATAAEYGVWTAIVKAPKRVRSGTYLASWRKFGADWQIVYEAYVSLGSAPQSIADVVKPTATITLGGTPDWLVVTDDSVWVANAALRAIQRVDVGTNTLTARVTLPGEPCSGLAYGFGSVWVPLCGARPSLARVDPVTDSVAAILPFGPSLSEGGITTSNDSVWMAIGNGKLARIDPRTNRVRQTISLARGSYNPLFSNGTVWVTSGDENILTALDALNGKIIATIGVGSKPRFLAAGDGVVYALNQGDGTVTMVDAKSKRVTATIAAGIPGGGGEITYGAGSAWATIIGVPLTRIEAKTRTVQQWGGRGGDAVRFGHASIWLTDYHNGLLWRIPNAQFSSARIPQ